MFPWWLSNKESSCNAGDTGSASRSGRSPAGGNGNPLQYSCLKNPMDRGAWRATVHGVANSRTQLSISLQMLPMEMLSRLNIWNVGTLHSNWIQWTQVFEVTHRVDFWGLGSGWTKEKETERKRLKRELFEMPAVRTWEGKANSISLHSRG